MYLLNASFFCQLHSLIDYFAYFVLDAALC